MNLPPLPLLVLDTETTGLVPRVHRVIEFASMEIRDGKMVKEYEQLFACKAVPPVVEVLTRVRTADLSGRPSFEEKRDEVLAHIPEDCILVGQNIGFDLGMLKGEGIDLTDRPWIDTSMLASLVFPELRSYSLGYLSAVLELKHDPPHRALGDVRATLELLSKCWERFGELPEKLLKPAREIMERGAPGYRTLFAALPVSTAKKNPSWLARRPLDDVPDSTETIHLDPPKVGAVELYEEPLDPGHLAAILRGSLGDAKTRQWIAVKNLRSTLRRLPPDLRKAIDDDTIRPIRSFSVIANDGVVKKFLKQETFTADEATTAVKLRWYSPAVAGAKAGASPYREELPLHGGEDAVWNGKLRATADAAAYLDQFTSAPSVILLDHRELLSILEAPEHPAQKLLDEAAHVIIDDASMLEDTATKAYGWNCRLDDLRAAAAGDELLTRFTDLLQFWIEKVRTGQDLRYITDGDVRTPEARGLREQLETVLNSKTWPERIAEQLQCIAKVLDPMNLSDRLTWIELRQNGSQMLESVPEYISHVLQQSLFSRIPTTLLIPQGCADMLPEILPPKGVSRSPHHSTIRPSDHSASLPLSLSSTPTLEDFLSSPPSGKTMILLPGKSTIEALYVKYTEVLEAKGVTLICQGMAGGQGRMQAEFLAAPAPTIWMLTPWMFEGMELPAGTVDHLLLKTLPFDHPSHAVISRRAAHYQNAFEGYSLPRLLHRLFRLLRTFARFRTESGDVRVLDERLWSKSYGKKVQEYLNQFGSAIEGGDTSPPEIQLKATKKPRKPKKDKGQLTMF